MNLELQVLLFLAIIILVSKVAGHLSQRWLNQPIVFGEILAGVLLGPTLLNIFGWPIFGGHTPVLHGLVDLLARLGVLLLMFIAGLETDLQQMRQVGKAACWTAACGVALPLVGGTLVSRLFGLGLWESIFIGTVLTATSVSISAQTLLEIGRLKTREGMTILGGAVIDDILGIIILSFVVAFSVAHADGTEQGVAAWLTRHLAEALGQPQAFPYLHIGIILLLMAIFFAAAILIGLRVFPRLLAVAERLHASHAISAAALLLMLLFAFSSEFFGQVAAITGAYLAGIFLARTRYRERITRSIDPFTYALFVPVFFMGIGLGANARALGEGTLWFVLTIIAVAIFTKVIGCGLGARLCGFTTRESLCVGIGMVSRGEVGLIVARIGLDAGVIGTREYAGMIIMVLASTVVTPILLRLASPRVAEVQSEVYESVVAIEAREEYADDAPPAGPPNSDRQPASTSE